MAKLDRVKELLKLMEAHGLAEIEFEEKDSKIRLKKQATVPEGPVALVAGAGPAPPVGAGAPGAAAQAAEAAAGANTHTITSPIVGTFYRSPSPDAEPFVEAGDPVDPDAVVCIVEAMKVMNEVKAEVQGTVEKALVESGTAVEYGQPLFRVAKS